MTTTPLQRSRKLRQEAEQRDRECEASVSIQVRIAYKVCDEMNGGHGRCVCSKTRRSVCERMEGMARSIIDEVRKADRAETIAS